MKNCGFFFGGSDTPLQCICFCCGRFALCQLLVCHHAASYPAVSAFSQPFKIRQLREPDRRILQIFHGQFGRLRKKQDFFGQVTQTVACIDTRADIQERGY